MNQWLIRYEDITCTNTMHKWRVNTSLIYNVNYECKTEIKLEKPFFDANLLIQTMVLYKFIDKLSNIHWKHVILICTDEVLAVNK